MARITSDSLSENTGIEGNSTVINAEGQSSIEVPNAGFIADAEMTRDGQDLMLQAPDDSSVTIENYFLASPAPTIEAPNGATLSPNLVNSFAQSPATYAQNGSMNDESPVGAAEEVNGAAVVVRADGTSEPISLGTPIYQGDIIETSPTGAVNIAFIDETSMAVSENARMSIDEYSFDPSTESGTTDLSVIRGVFVYTSGLIGRDDPDDVKIETPVGSIGIRGTIIAGNISPDGESSITVIEGAIVVKNALMEQTLSEQFESVKLTGLNSSIKNVGTLDAKDIGEAYGSASSVIPKLFSSINDVSDEEGQKQEQQEDKLEAEQAEEAQEASEAEEAPEVEATEEGEKVDLKNPLNEEKTSEVEELDVKDQANPDSKDKSVRETREIKQAVENQDPDTIINVRPAVTNGGGGPVVGSTKVLEQDISIGDINNDGFDDSLRAFVVNGDTTADRLVEVVFGNDTGLINAEVVIPQQTTTFQFGQELESLGDINGDGYLDFAITDSRPGQGLTNIYSYDHTNNNIMDVALGLNLHGQTGGHTIKAIGNFITDTSKGLSNFIFISEEKIDFGGVYGEQYSATIHTSATAPIARIYSDNQIITAENVKGWTGDAYDDLAISVFDGTNVITYVIPGSQNLSFQIFDLDALSNYIVNTTPLGGNDINDWNIVAGNDGDYTSGGFGLDDFFVGFDTDPASMTFVGGNQNYDGVNYATRFDDDPLVAGLELGVASTNHEAIYGDTHLNDGALIGVSMRGNSNDQDFVIHNDNFRKIDGGNGEDTLVISGNVHSGNTAYQINFSGINFEQIEQIENIEIFNGSRLQLSHENIFNMMKTSDNGTLKIMENDTGPNGGSDGILWLDGVDQIGEYAAGNAGVVQFLEENGATVSNVDVATEGAITYDVFTVGDHQLYIDQALNSDAV